MSVRQDNKCNSKLRQEAKLLPEAFLASKGIVRYGEAFWIVSISHAELFD